MSDFENIYYIHSDDNINEYKKLNNNFNIDKHIKGIILPEHVDPSSNSELYDFYDKKQLISGICSNYFKEESLLRVI